MDVGQTLCGLWHLGTVDGGGGISLADPTKGLFIESSRSEGVAVGWSAHGGLVDYVWGLWVSLIHTCMLELRSEKVKSDKQMPSIL